MMSKDDAEELVTMMGSANPASIFLMQQLGAHTIPELIRVASPVYVKFGLRNAPDIHPIGMHMEVNAIARTRQRVRRAQLGAEMIRRYAPTLIQSNPGAPGLGVPAPQVLAGSERTE